MRVGVAHHLGWAIVVTATDDHRVIDRRRIELVEPGLPAAPIHHEGGAHALHRTGPVLTDEDLEELVVRVRTSAQRLAASALDDLAESVAEPIVSISVRDWRDDAPTDIATLRRPPHEARADSVMYCQVLAAAGGERGWAVHRYDRRSVGAAADGVDLGAPRAILGPPWTADHRMALAATVAAARSHDLGGDRPGSRD